MKRISASVALGLVLALLLAGCGRGVVDAGPVGSDPGGTDPDTTDDVPDDVTDPTTDPGQPGQPSDDTGDVEGDVPDEVTTTAIRLYFMAPGGGGTPGRADPFLVSVQREISSTPRIALATLRELVDGPSAAEQAMIGGISTAVPDQTLVLDVIIDDGLATINLSREFESGGGSLSMFSRLAQVVYTATQFPTVDEVTFELDGQPVTVFSGEGIVLDHPVSRDDYLEMLPTVFVDTPAAGAVLPTGGHVTGMAAVFEATFQYRLEAADGTVLAEDFAMSDHGMGWGAFDFTISYAVGQRQTGRLVVFEESAMDGSVQAERVTPVVLLP